MTADDANSYIGLPWKLGARGLDAYDCWGLLMHCRACHFRGGIHDVEFGEPARQMYAYKMRSGEWEIVAMPAHGDGGAAASLLQARPPRHLTCRARTSGNDAHSFQMLQ